MMFPAILRGLSKISQHCKFDILWRITQRLSLKDRRILAWRFISLDVERITFRRNGTLWTGKPTDEFVVAPLYCDGHFQGEGIDALLNWINQRKRLTASRNVIVDIGAHIGTTCIPFAQKTDAHILAIEPVPETFQLLQQNVTQNNLGHRITCVQKAVYQQRACLEMGIPKRNDGGAFIMPKSKNDMVGLTSKCEIRETRHVSAELLISVLRESGIQPERVAFVWCDVEGSEVEVIESGTELWSSGVPLYLEINPAMLNLQQHLHVLPDLIKQYFDRYLASSELSRYRSVESFHSTSELPGFIDHLENGVTDILLLPKGFE